MNDDKVPKWKASTWWTLCRLWHYKECAKDWTKNERHAEITEVCEWLEQQAQLAEKKETNNEQPVTQFED